MDDNTREVFRVILIFVGFAAIAGLTVAISQIFGAVGLGLWMALLLIACFGGLYMLRERP